MFLVVRSGISYKVGYIPTMLQSLFFSCKKLLNSYRLLSGSYKSICLSPYTKHVVGAQKYSLNEKVLLSTLNICF